jgi:hypothetical protein
MQQVTHFVLSGVKRTVAEHLGALLPGSTTFVSGNGHLCPTRADFPRCPYPDILIAFSVDQADIITTNGYVKEEASKPPDLVLEEASRSTSRRDYIQ